MRDKLKQIGPETRRTYTGIFVRTSIKTTWAGYGYKPVNTILLKNITDVKTGKIVTDHLWFNLTKGFGQANPSEGDILQFNARVQKYTKGYLDHRGDYYLPPSVDWKLSRPTKIINLSAVNRSPMTSDGPTDAQSSFIRLIADTLNLSVPDLASVYEASKWIDKHIDAFQQKKEKRKTQERTEK